LSCLQSSVFLLMLSALSSRCTSRRSSADAASSRLSSSLMKSSASSEKRSRAGRGEWVTQQEQGWSAFDDIADYQVNWLQID
jgi:hypothetical protein